VKGKIEKKGREGGREKQHAHVILGDGTGHFSFEH